MKEKPSNGENDEQSRGLECPRCGCKHLPVFYTRRMSEHRILRKRICRNCGRKVVTYETIEG